MPGLIISNRVSILLVGMINAFVIYTQTWTKRDVLNSDSDSFWLEFLYIASCAFAGSISYVAAPYTFEFVPYSEDISAMLWDIPLVYLLPFILLKLIDLAGHVPLKELKVPYLFPIERVDPSKWNRKAKVARINFELNDSLETEYDMFSWHAKPFIEAPIEEELGKVFRLCIQIRREKGNFSAIQDMGDEYDGDAQFCWLFYKKAHFLKPKSWFNKNKYLNPFLSITANGIQPSDIIIAQRIHGDGSHYAVEQLDYPIINDDEKTVIIPR